MRAEVDFEVSFGSTTTSAPVGKGRFMSGNAEALTVTSRYPTSGPLQAQEVRASVTALAAGPSTKVVINGFGLIGYTRFGAISAVKTSLSIL